MPEADFSQWSTPAQNLEHELEAGVGQVKRGLRPGEGSPWSISAPLDIVSGAVRAAAAPVTSRVADFSQWARSYVPAFPNEEQIMTAAMGARGLPAKGAYSLPRATTGKVGFPGAEAEIREFAYPTNRHTNVHLQELQGEFEDLHSLLDDIAEAKNDPTTNLIDLADEEYRYGLRLQEVTDEIGRLTQSEGNVVNIHEPTRAPRAYQDAWREQHPNAAAGPDQAAEARWEEFHDAMAEKYGLPWHQEQLNLAERNTLLGLQREGGVQIHPPEVHDEGVRYAPYKYEQNPRLQSERFRLNQEFPSAPDQPELLGPPGRREDVTHWFNVLENSRLGQWFDYPGGQIYLKRGERRFMSLEGEPSPYELWHRLQRADMSAEEMEQLRQQIHSRYENTAPRTRVLVIGNVMTGEGPQGQGLMVMRAIEEEARKRGYGAIVGENLQNAKLAAQLVKHFGFKVDPSTAGTGYPDLFKMLGGAGVAGTVVAGGDREARAQQYAGQQLNLARRYFSTP